MAALPTTLFGLGEPELAPHADWRRIELDTESWVDVARLCLLGADALLDELCGTLPFHQGQRVMWGNLVDEPRLSCGLPFTGAPPIVPAIAHAFSTRYGVEFRSCFVNYYRNGDDSVAWHSDREGKIALNPLVAIVSLGGPRRFGVRPKGRGRQHSFLLHSGDVLVMGGACQHRFEHSVPKMSHAAPRVSLSFRHHSPTG
jgi:alkylated DNA repair dioxygenase AlkB